VIDQRRGKGVEAVHRSRGGRESLRIDDWSKYLTTSSIVEEDLLSG